jgi:hypothetical protein
VTLAGTYLTLDGDCIVGQATYEIHKAFPAIGVQTMQNLTRDLSSVFPQFIISEYLPGRNDASL